MKHSSNSNEMAGGWHLPRVGQYLQRMVSLVGGSSGGGNACRTRAGRCASGSPSARPTRSEIFRQVQREKWLGVKPAKTPPPSRYGDLYKRPLVDPNTALPARPARRSSGSNRSAL